MRKPSRKALLLLLPLAFVAVLIAVFAWTRPSRPTSSRGASSAAPSIAPTEAATPSPAPTASPTPTPFPSPAPSPTPLPLSRARICIDPGHQRKRDSRTEALAPWSDEQKARTASGTQGVRSGMPEYEYTLSFSLELAEALRQRGAQVLLTREDHDVTLSNIERAEMGNAYAADIVLRIHCDGAEDAKRNGIGMFVARRADPDGVSAAYARELLDALVAATGARSGGVHISDTYTGLNWSTVPSILVELGYMTNPDEDERLQTPEYRALLVSGIVRWCEARFGGRGAAEGGGAPGGTVPDASPGPTATPAPEAASPARPTASEANAPYDGSPRTRR